MLSSHRSQQQEFGETRVQRMWVFQPNQLPGGHGLRCNAERDSHVATFAEVLQAWQDDAAFRSLFNAQLAAAAYAAFRWETPPVTDATARRPFEFVVLDSPELLRPP